MSGNLALFCERMRYWCEQASLGYDQTQRWDIRDGGECDCSSLVIHSLREAGFDTGSASWTGDIEANLTVRGWVRLEPWLGTARPGDVLLRHNYGNGTGHVCAVVSGYGWDAMVGEAWLDENGGVYYGQSGDQTLLETRIRQIYSYPWDMFLRYAGQEEDMEPGDLTNYSINTVDEGNTPLWQVWAWNLKYAKEAYYQTSAMSAAIETLASKAGADPYEIAKSVQKAVKEKLDTLKVPEIDYGALAEAVASKVQTGADAATIAKATANELYKRLKA